jgi:hypothetical protein
MPYSNPRIIPQASSLRISPAGKTSFLFGFVDGWRRAECPRHNGCRLLHGYGQAFKPDSEIPSEAGFANQGGTEGMENTEDLCPAFFEGDRWFPYDLCGLCFLCASVVVKASSVILTSVSGLNQDSRGGTVPPEGQPAMAVRPCRQR